MKKPFHTFTKRNNKPGASARGGIVLAALLSSLGAIVPTLADAAADLGGVWVVKSYSKEIKTSDGKAPPLLPEAAKLYGQRQALLAKGDVSFDPVAERCGPPGLPRVMMMPYAFEIVHNPQRMIFLFEWNRLYRRVDMNGPSMQADDLQLTGRATGRWDGDTLVIDTRQIDDTLLDASGMPHGTELKITERLRLLADGTLENRMRFEDAETFRAPWETVVTYRRLPKGTELSENICLDRLMSTPAIEENHYRTYPK